MKRKSPEQIVFIFFLAVGLIVLAVGAAVCLRVFDYRDTVDTKGVITRIESYEDFDGETGHEVYVRYTADGVEYESRLSSYSSSFYEGKEIDIYYKKSSPAEIGVKSLDYLVLMLLCFGLLFAAFGGIGLFVRYRAGKQAALLRLTGVKVEATYVKTAVNATYRINHRHPFRVICEWTDPMTNQKRTFKSGNLWQDPSAQITACGLTTFPVYIDERNPKKYTVDVDMLME